MTEDPHISLADLPDGSQVHMDFFDSSWFQKQSPTRALPSPEYVRSFSIPGQRLRPVVFEDLALIVKHGPNVSTSEAISLWAMRKVFHDQVPVPEVYGWRVVGGEGKIPEVFIYMQLIHGPTLEQRWDSMSHDDKQMVCVDLDNIVSQFRKLKQNGSEQVIGSLSQGAAPDRCLEFLPLLRPFSTRAVFHDWLSWLWRRHVPDPQSIEDPWRNLLPDDGPIVFTHGDLRPANIIVSATSPARVVAIVDWEQAGWYPDYWEYCKASFTAVYNGEWRAWIGSFVVPHEDALEAFDFYTNTLGIF
ncbi:phosphotransferase enzyme family protein [Dothidotthia symphoricarpi CBS 119687]|uniref:Phosphotransferase enzyme family protein n=1 Tax=Dothidotthia symphoricarpi CBS 119687 TaxID=1392245 RepID=A0A6A6AR19_9PLEO|nr:phosphotransferase enzyme family protein [Dothidotthia symphoricarpi CBS 119687]KAF2134432.1 phosphotransferase enzyme family protein [Dothidotthia symphoricarpi CBS 119687]